MEKGHEFKMATNAKDAGNFNDLVNTWRDPKFRKFLQAQDDGTSCM
jgi:hypothetical protein